MALDLEADVFVEADGVLIARAGVTAHGAVLVGDGGDEALAEPLATMGHVDGQKEHVAVAADGREANELLLTGEDEIDGRSAIGVGEEAAALFEHPLLAADALFQLPRGVEMLVIAGLDDTIRDIDTHRRALRVGNYNSTARNRRHNAFDAAPAGEGMASASDSRESSGLLYRVREWLITGAALTIPFLITVMILGFVLNFLSNVLTPVVAAARVLGLVSPVVGFARAIGLGPEFGSVFIEFGTVFALVAIVLAVGFVAHATSSDRKLSAWFHTAMEAIPGVGSVYTSFRRMSDVLLESDTSSFQDVKLVEFPNEGTYSFAFVTAKPPATVDEAASHDDLRTLFMPLAPNPVMGGFLIHVPAAKVYDVDLTVEQAVSAIVTSGVAIGDTEGAASLSADEMAALGEYDAERTTVAEGVVGGPGEPTERPDETDRPGRGES